MAYLKTDFSTSRQRDNDVSIKIIVNGSWKAKKRNGPFGTEKKRSEKEKKRTERREVKGKEKNLKEKK